MHDVIFTTIIGQEVVREVQKRQFTDADLDELSKQEMWDSLDSAPSIKTIVRRTVSFFKRRKSAERRERQNTSGANAQSTQCAPQG